MSKDDLINISQKGETDYGKIYITKRHLSWKGEPR